MSFGDINRVNTNLQAMSSQFSLNKINSKLGENQLKLSTGLRINRAEDDAAGFSIASKLSSKLAGLEQADRNVGDAKSMLDVAESGMNSIMDTLVDMKAKATQGATDSVGSDERAYLKSQIEALGKEINDVAGSTKFQDTTLLDGSTTTLTFQVGEGNGDTYDATLSDVQTSALFTDAMDGVTTAAVGGFAIDGSDGAAFGNLLNAVDGAIDTVAGAFNQIGIDQNSLSIKQENLSQQITSNSAARSRIQDADFAKVQSESVKLQIMQQTATSALAQANSSPQAVLGFLG